MNTPLNPYASPTTSAMDILLVTPRFRVDLSKTTLREFCNLSGRPILGFCVWIALKLKLFKLNSMIIDGPRPFKDDWCNFQEIQEPVASLLISKRAIAEKLGFHSPRYSVCNTIGIVAHGGGILMLHESLQMYVSILASSSGSVVQCYENLVSVTCSPHLVLTTSNGRPNYKIPNGAKTTYVPGISINRLIELHLQQLQSTDRKFIPFGSYAEAEPIMDHISNLYFTDKIERGIFVPET